MSDTTWTGTNSTNASDPGNWSAGVPTSTVNAIFKSGAANNCNITQLSACLNLQIGSDFNAELISTGTNTIDIHGQLIVGVASKIKPTHAIEFEFQNNPSLVVYDGGGSAYTYKPHVLIEINTGSMFGNDTARSNTTFDFGSTNFTMIDGVYPNITGTGTLYAKNIYSDASRTLHNSYGSVDILAVNGLNVASNNFNIYDYDKVFNFEGALTALGTNFRFGHTTAAFKATGEDVKLPVMGEINSGAWGTNQNFYVQYHKVIIKNAGTTNYFRMGGRVLECNELFIQDGGRLYGPSDGTQAATIKSIKRPTIHGDWNFSQVADGVYKSITDISNLDVAHGGTGLQTLGSGSILYGQGMQSVGLLALGSAGDVLAVNGAGTGIEWSSTGGTNIELNELSDVTITSAAEQEILRYDATANEWVNETHDRQFIRVKAAEAVSKGDVVYIFDVHNANVVKVKKARADSTSTMPAIGIMYETLALDAEGLAVVFGKANGIAANYTAGDTMYVSPTTAGALTDTKPTSGSHLIQNVGILMQAHASNASVKVTGVGRSNDIPNATITTNSADADYVYIDDGNVWKKITPANLGIGAGSDTNTFVIVGEESDDFINASASAGNANGFQFSYGNGAQNTTKSSSGLDFGVMIPVACTLSRLDFTFGNIGNEDNTNNQTITVFKNATATTTTVTFNCNGSGGSAFTKSFSSLSGSGLSYSAGDRFNLRTTGLSGFSSAGTQIGPARMTAYFTVA